MSNEQKINKILEWLYINDHNCSSAKDWREKFIKMIKETIGNNYGDDLIIGSQPYIEPKICTCNTTSGMATCPRHS